MLMTEAGKLAWKAQLDLYGVPREERAGIEDADRTTNPLRYPGQYYDEETGLSYNRFRYYDPETGRYISQDPIGVAGGLDLHGYVHNPATWEDPFGLGKKCNINKYRQDELAAIKPPGKGWHMHHIAMEGAFSHWGEEARGFVEKSREILAKAGYDIQNHANICWAPNADHSADYAEKFYNFLQKEVGSEPTWNAVDTALKKYATTRRWHV
jgi:RHS repeat-associated protein